MIKEFEPMHGLVFLRLIHATQQEISVRAIPAFSNSSYVVNGRVGVYVKYSTKRLSPWQFSFNKEHLDDILMMRRELAHIVVALVCGTDGIAALTFAEFENVIGESVGEVGWITVSRKKRAMYGVKGSAGELRYKIADNDVVDKITSSGDDQPSQQA